MFSRIYIHIPFCLQKCPYCAFYSLPCPKPQELDSYVELLRTELELAVTRSPGSGLIDSVYFGGGTPSLLEAIQVERLLGQIDLLCCLDGNAEITLETNPGTVNPGKLAAFRMAGVNRLSIGVQSFDDRMLKALGRAHNAREACSAFEAAARAGFRNIGIDLINALPGQDAAAWQRDLKAAIDLEPQHISVYGLTIEEQTPFAERYQEDDPLLPDDDQAAGMFEAAEELLCAHGFEHYEIANYARPGFRSRHNSGYWLRDGYLGLGAGAHSFIKDSPYGTRYSNRCDLEHYRHSLGKGSLPRSETTALEREDAMAEFMYLGLRLADGVTISAFQSQFGSWPDEIYGSSLKTLLNQGLLAETSDGYRLTRRGTLLSNQVFQKFLP